MTNYLIIAVVIILLIVSTFMLMLFLPKPQCFYIPLDTCQELLLFDKDEYKKDVFEEVKNITETTMLYNGISINSDFHKWQTLNMLLQSIPDLSKAELVFYKTKFMEAQHKDNNELYLKCVYPIITPSKKAGIWCEGEKRLFKKQEWLIYDPTQLHYTFNESKKENALCLILDIPKKSKWHNAIKLFQTKYE